MNKYHNNKINVDGITFDSKDEAKYYEALKDKKAKGLIQNFELQPKFVLQESFTKNNKTYKQITYKADFRVYTNEGISYCVDVKGMLTDVFKIKLKLFNKKFNEELKLVCRNLKYGDEYGFIDFYELKKLRKRVKKIEQTTKKATRETDKERTKEKD